MAIKYALSEGMSMDNPVRIRRELADVIADFVKSVKKFAFREDGLFQCIFQVLKRIGCLICNIIRNTMCKALLGSGNPIFI